MAGSICFDGGWHNFDGFAVVLSGGWRETLEIVPRGLFEVISPLASRENFLSLTIRVTIRGTKGDVFTSDVRVGATLGVLYQLLDDLEAWDADGDAGFRCDMGEQCEINVQHAESTQGWNLHFRLTDQGVTLQGHFPLDRGCLAPARDELAAIVRCIRSEIA